MALFKKKSPQGAPTPIDGFEKAPVDTPRVETIRNWEELNILATDYSALWEQAGSYIDSLDFSDAAEHLEISIVELQPNMRASRKATSKIARHALLQVVLSARISADRNIDYVPSLYGQDTVIIPGDIYDTTYKEMILKMKQSSAILEDIFANIEKIINRVTYILLESIKPEEVDSFIEELRALSLQPEYANLLTLLADEVHSPDSQIVQKVSITTRIGDHTQEQQKQGFAEFIQNQDGEYAHEFEILSFAVSALSSRGIDADIPEIIKGMPKESWAPSILEAFDDYREKRAEDTVEEVKELTRPYFIYRRRKPTLDELREVETITQPLSSAEILNFSHKPQKRQTARISEDYLGVATPRIEVKPKVSRISAAKVLNTGPARELQIIEAEEEYIISNFIEDYITRESLRGPEAQRVRLDLQKMITALKFNPTRNKGVTRLSEVRSLRDNNAKTHTVWRLNPAHYNGLSVGRKGKDTRIIYTLGPEKCVTIIGIYNHDDYEQAIVNLR